MKLNGPETFGHDQRMGVLESIQVSKIYPDSGHVEYKTDRVLDKEKPGDVPPATTSNPKHDEASLLSVNIAEEPCVVCVSCFMFKFSSARQKQNHHKQMEIPFLIQPTEV